MRMREALQRGQKWWGKRYLTLFAKTILILVTEVVLNALMWIISAIVFSQSSVNKEKVLGLALVAWTTGLRHGLDADHISAIDNATRRIVSVPLLDKQGLPRIRRPVTVGLFFSLGHSTIVVVTIVAIAISAKIANHLDDYGNVGSIIGASVSGSFLILIGCINTVILYRTWSRLRYIKRKQKAATTNGEDESVSASQTRFNGFLTRLAMPLLRTVDRPWKLFPVGLLFGLGFDTASSIALLSVAVIAQQGGDGGSANGNVVMLAFLFTAGMTLVDSIDSCLMIWAYAPDLARDGRRRLTLWEESSTIKIPEEDSAVEGGIANEKKPVTDDEVQAADFLSDKPQIEVEEEIDEKAILEQDKNGPPAESVVELTPSTRTPPEQLLATLDESASRLSLVLTFLSILIAFAIGIIVLLGLIGDQCHRCTRAADQQQQSGNGGLEGRWWLAWRKANDNSGYVGAAIVGLFATCVGGYFIVRWLRRRKKG